MSTKRRRFHLMNHARVHPTSPSSRLSRCLVSIHLAVFAIDLAESDVSRVALLRFVRVAGVHLLQVHRAVVDEEPDAGGALDSRFVLVLARGVRVKKSQASAKGFRIVAARSTHRHDVGTIRFAAALEGQLHAG